MTEKDRWRLALAPDVPWKQIKGMRNPITHEYFDVEPDLVWRVVDEHIGALLSEVERLLDTRTPR